VSRDVFQLPSSTERRPRGQTDVRHPPRSGQFPPERSAHFWGYQESTKREIAPQTRSWNDFFRAETPEKGGEAKEPGFWAELAKDP
jgi:hypothetical protein